MELSIIKIKSITDGLLDWVRADLAANVLTPTYSWLYDTFNECVLDDTNFYVELKNMLEQGDEYSTKLATRLMFDKDRATLPTIHIHYPNEDGNATGNSINTGFEQDSLNSLNNIEGYFNRSYSGNYEMIITGGNSLQVVMLYEFMNALLIASADTLSLNFDIFKFSGKQLMSNSDIIPHLTFYRSISISLQSPKKVRSLLSQSTYTGINFEGNFAVQQEVRANCIYTITTLGAVGNKHTLTIDGYNIATYTVKTGDTVSDAIDGIQSSLIDLEICGFVSKLAPSITISAPIGLGALANGTKPVLAPTGTAAGTITNFTGGITSTNI